MISKSQDCATPGANVGPEILPPQKMRIFLWFLLVRSESVFSFICTYIVSIHLFYWLSTAIPYALVFLPTPSVSAVSLTTVQSEISLTFVFLT